MRRKIALGSCVVLMALCMQAFSCNYHNLVVIEHDYKSSVNALQQAEANEYAAGNVPANTHLLLQGLVVKMAQGGEATATLLQQNASKQTVAQQVVNINGYLQTFITQGLVGIKNPTSQKNLAIMAQGISDIVQNFATALGAPLSNQSTTGGS